MDVYYGVTPSARPQSLYPPAHITDDSEPDPSPLDAGGVGDRSPSPTILQPIPTLEPASAWATEWAKHNLPFEPTKPS